MEKSSDVDKLLGSVEYLIEKESREKLDGGSSNGFRIVRFRSRTSTRRKNPHLTFAVVEATLEFETKDDVEQILFFNAPLLRVIQAKVKKIAITQGVDEFVWDVVRGDSARQNTLVVRVSLEFDPERLHVYYY